MEEVVLRLKELLFPSIADVAVLSVDVNVEVVRVEAHCTADGAVCPVCGVWSNRVHGSYLRFPADVPSGGRSVVLQLRVRRFTCRNSGCARRTFVEQISGLTRRHGQRTERLRSTLAAVGLALAGRAGARIARVLGMSVSRSTVLRLVDALPEPEVAAPRVVGVDEYATRKGRHYGTVLVDIETRRPIDLLPDREASSLAAWLAERPGVEVICRDRAPFFAEGASAGAPQAVQVADRWHLWHNLSEAAERAVAQHRRCLRVLVPAASEPEPEPAPEEEPPGSPWPTGHRFADRTRARHAAVHALLEAGHSRRSIQRQLGMTWRAVKQLAEAAAPEELFTGQWQNRPSVLDDYKPYLDDRWNEGFTNAWKLWEEIMPLGYKGSYQRVRAYLHKKRTSLRPVTAQPPSPRTVAGWILSRPETLTEPEQLQLKTVRAHCPELDALTRHVRSFAVMLTERQGERLPEWLDTVRQDDLPSLHTLAAGIDRDLDAVTAGLTLPWSSGAVEGHVNRIKMLKRQMFGRAGFALLRKRVLLAQ
ncbi:MULTISPECIES: ISL3 family transposase [unclassified Streptomyces]|uniref:ISL3 family transposase n=1 Tax=unclassified Streptomyces TaxID=2593676 RepID=UPI0029BD00A1|nr:MULTISPECIES: ISL3 family transposase [unclassified Streptomyces]MDX3771675.1 ISL3 family transposase [Streptomyces sp. AK08-01B]MDX3820838.1 ISL3 family transposase [Streptomyces sp. AK08-01A]